MESTESAQTPIARILYVDDEDKNLTVFEAAFEDDFEVHVASSAREATRILREHEIDLLITDQRMPEMTGVQLLEAVSGDYPEMVRMVLTGYTDIQAIIQAINTGRIDQYMTKPYNPVNLKLAMERELQLKDIVRQNRALVSRLEDAANRAQALREVFQKYVPEPVVKNLLDSPRRAAAMVGEDRIVTVLFAGISRFRNVTLDQSPGDVVGFLNEYVDAVNRIVIRNKGLICNIVADELLIVFGAPVSALENERKAIDVALQMVDAMEEINRKMAVPVFGVPLTLRIGIHRGEVIAGNIGSVRKMEYGIVGDTVNTASRIRDLARHGVHDILISDAVKRWLLDDDLRYESMGPVRLRGRAEDLELFRVGAEASNN